MALALDVCTMIRKDVDDTFKAQLATVAEVTTAIEFFQNRDWKQTPGLRPWTHTNFIRSLNAADRAHIIDEITAVFRTGRFTAEECRYGR